MFRAKNFAQHGRSFVIEAEDWTDAESAAAAVIALHSWAMALGPQETASLHGALRRERTALLHDAAYDRQAPPLVAVRDAQRLAIRAGLAGHPPSGQHPIVTLEAAEDV